MKKLDPIFSAMESRHPNLDDPKVRASYGIKPKDTRPPVFDKDGKEIDCYQPGGDATGKCVERNILYPPEPDKWNDR